MAMASAPRGYAKELKVRVRVKTRVRARLWIQLGALVSTRIRA